MTALISAQDALVYVMVTASAADSMLRTVEADAISGMMRRLPAFSGYDDQHLRAAIAQCRELLSSEEGIDAIIGMAAEALTPALRETAYALAVEVAAADVRVGQEELVYLELLADRFEIPKLSIAAIEYSARVRYRKL